MAPLNDPHGSLGELFDVEVVLFMSIGFGVRRSALRSVSKRTKRPLWGLLCLGVVLSACGQAPSSKSDNAPTSGSNPDLAQTHATLISSTCTVTSSSLSVAVNAGETVIIALSATDGKVTVNGNQADGSACEAAPSAAITVTPGTDGDHSVYLDYSSGLFAKAIAANAPRIKLNLGTGVNDTLTVRGTSDNDAFYLGKGTTLNTYLLNVNGGVSPAGDAFADVSVVGAEHVTISAGAGDDTIDASGLYGTSAPYPTALGLYGGPGDDTIKGGAGDDTLSGDAGNDLLNGGKGNNTYAGGTTNDGTDVITVTTGAVDTVDYSQRFNPVSVVLNNSAVSGETAENDTIPDTVSTVLGGFGNDSLSAAGSTRAHTLMGGPGNDTLTGGSGSDTLLGGNGTLQVDGDDLFIGSKATANYGTRTAPITVTINTLGMAGADANDGDPATTRHVQTATHSSAGATIVAATNTLTGLQNMDAGSVGRKLVISGSTGNHDNGTYHIASVTNATSVVLNSTDTAANVNWADDNAAGWSFAEDAGAEKDEVRCQNVTGSATAANTISGDGTNNWITGGSDVDTLVGGDGDDTLIGFDGADTLYGGAGDDTLIGGAGNDFLHGGDGNDVLEGDGDADFFQCDGKNDATTNGSAPGADDYTVDYNPNAPDSDTRAIPVDCER
jgi:Ca2+-binding RTX toxin-like protein